MINSNVFNENKDVSNFWTLWIENKPRIQSCCSCWLNGNSASVEDALSLTIEKAHQHYLKSVEEIRSPFSWLCKIAHNICIDIHRERKKQNILNEMAINLPDQYFFSMYESEALEEKVQRESLLESVYGALNSLSPDLKKVIYHRFIDEMDYAEIAENMEITQDNARKRVQLARKKLRVVVV